MELGWKWDTEASDQLTPAGTDPAPTVFVARMRNDAFDFEEGTGSHPWGLLEQRAAPYSFRIRANPDGDHPHRFLFKRGGAELGTFPNGFMRHGFVLANVEAFTDCDSMFARFTNLRKCSPQGTSVCSWTDWDRAQKGPTEGIPNLGGFGDFSTYWYLERYVASGNAFSMRHCGEAECPDQFLGSQWHSTSVPPPTCEEELVPGQPCWSGWVRHDGQISGGPDAASWAPGRLDVFARGTNGHLLHRWFDGGVWGPGGLSGGWEDLGSPETASGSGLTSDPAAVSTKFNRIDVFARGPNMKLWRKRWNGTSWGVWTRLGAPTVADQSGSVLEEDEVPVLGSSETAITSAPDAASRWIPHETHLQVVARGPDGGLWRRTFSDGDWSKWHPMGGDIVGDPSIVSWGWDRLDYFARDTQSRLLHTWWDPYGGFGTWETHEGALATGPDAASRWANSLDVFAVGGGGLYRKRWDGYAWSGWEFLGGDSASDPGVVSWKADHLDVFIRGTDGAMWQRYCDPC